MNLPNKLTILRVIMIPFFVLFLLLDGGANTTYRYIAAAIFIVASFTALSALRPWASFLPGSLS